jgi:hypothetical protein
MNIKKLTRFINRFYKLAGDNYFKSDKFSNKGVGWAIEYMDEIKNVDSYDFKKSLNTYLSKIKNITDEYELKSRVMNHYTEDDPNLDADKLSEIRKINFNEEIKIINISLAKYLIQYIYDITDYIVLSLKCLNLIDSSMRSPDYKNMQEYHDIYSDYFTPEQAYSHAENINLKINNCNTLILNIESNLIKFSKEDDDLVEILKRLSNDYSEVLTILGDCFTDLSINPNILNIPMIIAKLDDSIQQEIEQYEKFDEQEPDPEDLEY